MSIEEIERVPERLTPKSRDTSASWRPKSDSFSQRACRRKIRHTYVYIIRLSITATCTFTIHFVTHSISTTICLLHQTHAEVWDAVDKVAATFELVGSRLGYNSPSPAHIVADCTNNVAIVVGDTRSAASLRVSDLARVRVEISVLENDGHPTKLARGIGHAGAFKEHPIESATWLANRLPRIIPGACIRAGDVVVTGAATLTKDVRPGATYVASFGGIGHVACTLARGEKAATARL